MRRGTCDLDVFPDITWIPSARGKRTRSFLGLSSAKTLGVVPSYRIKNVRDIISRYILDRFNHVGAPTLANANTEESAIGVNI